MDADNNLDGAGEETKRFSKQRVVADPSHCMEVHNIDIGIALKPNECTVRGYGKRLVAIRIG